MKTQKSTKTIQAILFYTLFTLAGLLLILLILWMVSASFMARVDVLAVPVNLLPPYGIQRITFNIPLFLIVRSLDNVSSQQSG